MRIRKNGKVIRLTESDLMRITRKVLREQDEKTFKYPSKMSPEIFEVLAQIGIIKNPSNKKIVDFSSGLKDVTFIPSFANSQGQSAIETAMEITFNCGKKGEKEICKHMKSNKSDTPWSKILREVQKTMKKIYSGIGSSKEVKGVVDVGRRQTF